MSPEIPVSKSKANPGRSYINYSTLRNNNDFSSFSSSYTSPLRRSFSTNQKEEEKPTPLSEATTSSVSRYSFTTPSISSRPLSYTSIINSDKSYSRTSTLSEANSLWSSAEKPTPLTKPIKDELSEEKKENRKTLEKPKKREGNKSKSKKGSKNEPSSKSMLQIKDVRLICRRYMERRLKHGLHRSVSKKDVKIIRQQDSDDDGVKSDVKGRLVTSISFPKGQLCKRGKKAKPPSTDDVAREVDRDIQGGVSDGGSGCVSEDMSVKVNDVLTSVIRHTNILSLDQ